MAELAISRLEARYHLPPSRQDEKQRLDRLLASAAGEALEAGLERLGLAGDGELCIREVKVPLRLSLRKSDDALMLAWADAMAAATLMALRAGDHRNVLRFASRREALADFARGVAQGDWRRGWAWRQLGLCEEGEQGVAQLARALAAEPEALVPVLVAVAEAGRLPELARAFETSWWPQLAALALTSVGWSSLSFSWVDLPAELAAGAADRPSRATDRSQPFAEAEAGAVIGANQAAPMAGEPASASAENVWTASPDRPAPGLLAALQRMGLPAAALPELRRSWLAALFEILEARPGSPLGQALAALVWLEVDPGRLKATSPAGRPALLAASAAALAAPVKVRPAPPVTANVPPSQPSRPATLAEAPDREGFAQRRLGATEWGGLLFLVGVADDLGLPEELAKQESLGRRPGRWVWHQLAMALAPTGAEDPAALAFAGLLPGNKSPAFEAEPASEEEQEALAALAERLLQATADRLGSSSATNPARPFDGHQRSTVAGIQSGNDSRRLDPRLRGDDDRGDSAPSSIFVDRSAIESPPEEERAGRPLSQRREETRDRETRSGEPEGRSLSQIGSPPSPSAERGAGGRGPLLSNHERAAMLEKVCRRPARVLADPGWIEIHFSLDDVDTTLRRARLDLDPGFVPWLGVVLRFVYG
jgi:hypothetical protein